MKIITEGHRYELSNFEDKEKKGQTIQFIEKEPILMHGKPGTEDDGKLVPTGQLRTINDGTTNEDVLDMLIDRMNYLQSKFPCRENALAITNMEQALMWLNKRTQDRVKRSVEGKHVA